MKTTAQFVLYMGPTPTRVLVKGVMMYPVVGKSDSNCRIGSIAVADDFSTCPFAVPTLIGEALVSGEPCGSAGAM